MGKALISRFVFFLSKFFFTLMFGKMINGYKIGFSVFLSKVKMSHCFLVNLNFYITFFVILL